jgi:hypothetical protein
MGLVGRACAMTPATDGLVSEYVEKILLKVWGGALRAAPREWRNPPNPGRVGEPLDRLWP